MAVGWIPPDSMAAAFAELLTALLGEVTDESATLHAVIAIGSLMTS